MSDEGSIIIKKVKKGGGHGHHGGAWKVAYADFVTAMMAFFLLLWLLNAVTNENLAGLADYFSPTIGVKDSMGIGFQGGMGDTSQGISRDDFSEKGIIFGAPESGPIMKVPDQETEVKEDTSEILAFSEAQEQLEQAIAQGIEFKDFEENILIDQTPEGLRIQIIDQDGTSMFIPGTAKLAPHTMVILKRISEVLNPIPNYISITGHTSAIEENKKNGYSNWELSADRANSARRFMISQGFKQEKIAKIIGKADNDPLDWERPENPRNERISVVMLRNAVLPHHKQSAPETLLSTEDKTDIEQYLKFEKQNNAVE